MLSVQFISTQNVWLHLIKMLTMSGDHWWLILHVPETVLVDNNLHCYKPIPTHCNSFAANVSRMWLNIHSAWAQDLGQLAETWWMTSIYSTHELVYHVSRAVVTQAGQLWPIWPNLANLTGKLQTNFFNENIWIPIDILLKFVLRAYFTISQRCIVLLFWLKCHSSCYKNEVI